METSPTDQYLRSLAREANCRLLDLLSALGLTLALGWGTLALGLTVFLVDVLQLDATQAWVLGSLLLALTIAGAWGHARSWWRWRGEQLLQAKLDRAHEVLVGRGLLRIVLENHPGHRLRALDPLGQPLANIAVGDAQRQVPVESMAQRLHDIVANYDTLLAHIPAEPWLAEPGRRRETRPRRPLTPGQAALIIGSGLALYGMSILNRYPATVMFVVRFFEVLALVGVVGLGGLLTRALALVNTNERLKQVALRTVLVAELGSPEALADLPRLGWLDRYRLPGSAVTQPAVPATTSVAASALEEEQVHAHAGQEDSEALT